MGCKLPKCCTANQLANPSDPRPRKCLHPILMLMQHSDGIVSLHERYAHVDVITREACTITFLFRYPSQSALPSITGLQARVDELQRKVHHLWSEVVDGETNKPFLRLRQDGPWSASEIVRDDTYTSEGGEQAASNGLEAGLMEQEIRRMRDRVDDSMASWQVTRYSPLAVTLSSHRHYIAISAYHHLLDGIGGLHLCQAILDPSYPIKSAPGLAPRMEDLISISPTLPYLIREAFHELVLPSFPAKVRSSIARKPCWPAEKAKGLPTNFPEAQVTIRLPPTWISSLKQVGKANGVSTLQPILQTAFVMAVYEVTGKSKSPITVCIPKNERDTTKSSHPQFGAVLLSTLHQTYNLASAASPAPTANSSSELFWSLARLATSNQSSPSSLRNARNDIGMLAYIPDPSSFTSPHSENPSRRTKTGWEEFFWTNIEKPNPYRTSIAISNLVGIAQLPPGCEGVFWSQSAGPFEHALIVSVVGHQNGLEVAVAFRDGCAVEKRKVKGILRTFHEILGSLAVGVAADQWLEGR